MRTPNTKCCLCEKPLYRRVSGFRKVRYFACLDCRDEVRRLNPTDKQMEALKLGRMKGDNHLTGYKHSEESKRKASNSHKVYWANHPEQAKARGEKTQGRNHYKWNGGSSKLNESIRLMAEHRKWMDGVKARGSRCSICRTTNNLKSHHITPFAVLLEKYNITNRNDARQCNELWDLQNGVTLCIQCHYKVHGREYAN